jgi:hypothetical protein
LLNEQISKNLRWIIRGGFFCANEFSEEIKMKRTVAYWNPFAVQHSGRWEAVDESDGNIHQITVAEDPETGDYTRLTRFKDGCSTEVFGAKSHDYPEEIFIVSGRLYDEALERWLEPGTYASRPPREVHGPFKADGDVVVLEISYLSQAVQ